MKNENLSKNKSWPKLTPSYTIESVKKSIFIVNPEFEKTESKNILADFISAQLIYADQNIPLGYSIIVDIDLRGQSVLEDDLDRFSEEVQKQLGNFQLERMNIQYLWD